MRHWRADSICDKQFLHYTGRLSEIQRLRYYKRNNSHRGIAIYVLSTTYGNSNTFSFLIKFIHDGLRRAVHSA